MVNGETTGSVLLTHEVGLHARPSVKLTKLAKTFQSTIELNIDGSDSWIDAKSIVKVMAAKAPQGSTLRFRASGSDAAAAIAALVALVERDFDEAEAHAGNG
ncbi:HPr family phosphocarrier protein [Bradyrhizobium sp. U87765 SZCCT0131]|uniref:HPr family phosphocarrier protein n=1 Tax=unclassified Bradyrhizobium TaxID=2631580 RepID=UPI001BACEB3A|nr:MULTISPECIES: HPr family phosphocarrier protein [unclassified Bradyrhizobium]MBR1217444.1 HPr family phosphocarrier protein [Bradyrhizobium sp. U87765 SZCCT0131]MBR1264959.1 HPr family phosphocarrier protein [Bradyrhizobium sp. U87765 SZCCT0134]MBR1304941.1 HPr family phosphocarrier protein [Bradyrhizobium sp. U87765 SZCCT0110]MBR1320727.1 HPr family phosphocarrier protein [Bradyrhizobium sp. U87765 SZCCT0109]MBR1349147.1 HPr family phosphocarrier protein [Bradyrhizobium sp. U87765 SZCCT004